MIQNDDILNMNFYKKEKFTGSYQGMRYLIQKDQEEDAEDENVKHVFFASPSGPVLIILPAPRTI